MAGKFALFLHGRYERRHLPFYKSLCTDRTLIAVDGGYRFFQEAGIVPDILIGDFDSIKRIPGERYGDVEIVEFPARKDKTDGHLALDYALDADASDIIIAMPDIGEPDHFVGNLMMLQVPLRRRRKDKPVVRIVNHAFNARILHNDSEAIDNANGDLVSVVPLGAVIHLTWKGTDYDVIGLRIPAGNTVGLRNRIISDRARLKVEGKALVIRQLSKPAG